MRRIQVNQQLLTEGRPDCCPGAYKFSAEPSTSHLELWRSDDS